MGTPFSVIVVHSQWALCRTPARCTFDFTVMYLSTMLASECFIQKYSQVKWKQLFSFIKLYRCQCLWIRLILSPTHSECNLPRSFTCNECQGYSITIYIQNFIGWWIINSKFHCMFVKIYHGLCYTNNACFDCDVRKDFSIDNKASEWLIS